MHVSASPCHGCRKLEDHNPCLQQGVEVGMETGKWRAQHGEAQSMTEAADRAQAVLTEAVLRRKPC